MNADLHGALRVGIGGPVDSGKTALVEALCKRFRSEYGLFVITNDIYTERPLPTRTAVSLMHQGMVIRYESGIFALARAWSQPPFDALVVSAT